jgi:hypothetical protein
MSLLIALGYFDRPGGGVVILMSPYAEEESWLPGDEDAPEGTGYDESSYPKLAAAPAEPDGDPSGPAPGADEEPWWDPDGRPDPADPRKKELVPA